MASTTDRQQHTAPVYAVFGSDDFLRQRAVQRIIRNVLGDARDGMALADFDGESARLAEVLDECRTASLLSPVRIVCVRGADSFVTNYREHLEKYVQSPSPCGILVLICERWAKNWRLYKLVEGLGGNVDCTPPAPWEVPRWLAAHARQEYGCTLAEATAARLADLAGTDLGLLDMEISKLATFVWPRTAIEMNDVEQLVGASRVETVFRITDAIARRDAPKALALWDQVLGTDRDAPYRAVGGLAFGFRKLAEMKRLLAKGLPAPEAAKRVGDPRHTAELQRQSARFSLEQWRRYLGKLLQIDVASKTGLGTVRSAVEKFIVELCTAP